MIVIKYEEDLILIEQHVIEVIKGMRQQKSYHKETGGMLLGSILSVNHGIVIRDYTKPLDGDYCSRYRYIRQKQSHNAILQKKWKQSNHTLMYLGEWHTHPEKEPHYSKQDMNNWKNLLKKSDTFTDYLLFIIGGIDGLKIWSGCRKTEEIVLLFEGEYNEDNSIS
ncbi:Mov34/MPN/PAD-1 family protein [Alkalihalobacillus hwajinpoensis]|uniref:Mov34/MPN/PAD-1 family protein n=1 Tax=Guptibacillus hwajinpoensis TaxID=208199 RepID=UPI0018840942|nr:Mov34/MPN/PAD-1 family protein [Pseudalkalibacillus hwajinpoensis]MBF0705795.1 Mov34/MPN/PAD-1 family protein [Pseudalkalibacillus hwajinpoensis]